MAFNAASQRISLMRSCIHRIRDSPILLLTYSPVLVCTPLPNENENVLATRPCQSSSTHGTSRNPIHAQTHFHRIRQENRSGSSPFGVCLYLQDGDCEFLTVFRCKIKGGKQGAEHRKVRLVVHSNYAWHISSFMATTHDI